MIICYIVFESGEVKGRGEGGGPVLTLEFDIVGMRVQIIYWALAKNVG